MDNKDKEQVESFEPNFDFSITPLNPILDFKDVAFVGCHIPTKDGKERLFLVTSQKNLIPCNQEKLNLMNMKVTHTPLNRLSKWSLKSIETFTKADSSLVNPNDIFNKIIKSIKKYVDFPEPEFMALWILGTYFHPLFRAYPYIFVNGIKGSGKTTLMDVVSLMTFNSLSTNNISTSAMFRMIQSTRPTMFIDENEKLINPQKSEDIRQILLSGYKQGFKVLRTEKNKDEQFQVNSFDVYSPKMIANISGVEDVLESRCIAFIMERTLNSKIGEEIINPSDPHWQDIRDDLYILLMENWNEIKTIYETIQNETKISNRDWELWRPILSIASFIGKDVYDKMKELAEAKVTEHQKENITESIDTIIVSYLLEVVTKDDWYGVSDILDGIKRENEDYQNAPWFNSKYLGRRLKTLGFKEDGLRTSKKRRRRMTPEMVLQKAQRLGITNVITSETSQMSLKKYSESDVSDVNDVSDITYSSIEDRLAKLKELKSRFGIKITKDELEKVFQELDISKMISNGEISDLGGFYVIS